MIPSWIATTTVVAALAVGCSGATGEPAQRQDFEDTPSAEVTSDLLHVSLYSLPSVSPVRGKNQVLLEISSHQGEQLDGSLDVELRTFMPAMGHGGSQQPRLASFTGNQYLFENVVLNMPGIWELHVEVRGEVEDSVVFEFDVD